MSVRVCLSVGCLSLGASLLPFLQVIAGFGAPFVWQVNKAVLPSVTVWSEGGDANVGGTPETHRGSTREQKAEQ